MKYFSINEFTRSDTANRLKIRNLPSTEHKTNIELLTDNVLDKLREWYGKPINISSGYRSYDLIRLSLEALRQANTVKEKLPILLQAFQETMLSYSII